MVARYTTQHRHRPLQRFKIPDDINICLHNMYEYVGTKGYCAISHELWQFLFNSIFSVRNRESNTKTVISGILSILIGDIYSDLLFFSFFGWRYSIDSIWDGWNIDFFDVFFLIFISQLSSKTDSSESIHKMKLLLNEFRLTFVWIGKWLLKRFMPAYYIGI